MTLPAAVDLSPSEICEGIRNNAFALSDNILRLLKHPAAAGALGPHVYDGAAGIALFLGACEHLSEQPSEARRGAVLALLAPLRRKLSRLATDTTEAAGLHLPVGGLVGLGSFLYAFALLARWLGDPDLLDAARSASALITPERIARDDRLDVMSGSAGAILALLALEDELDLAAGEGDAPGRSGTPGGSPSERAVACGEHLLARRVSHRDLPPAWPGPDGRPPLSGFSHGAAGISHALLRLAERTGRDDFRQAAFEGMEFERRLYDPEAGTWLDPRTGEPLEQAAWCHGAPGVALGRLGSLRVADDPGVRADLDLTLESTLSLPFSTRDHLCCGNLGRADILLQAARVLDDPGQPYLDEARALGVRAVARARREGGFAVEPVEVDDTVRVPDPTLFRGSAGVGYALLRLADPDALPCILSLEPSLESDRDRLTGRSE